MKASDRPRLSAIWWEKARPPELRGTELEKALPRAEKALAVERKRRADQRAIDDCVAALRAVPQAADRTIKRCDRRRHKEVISVLKKYHVLVKNEIARLQKDQRKLSAAADEAEHDNEEESDDQLFEPEYLYKMIKLMKSARKQLNFSFGLNTSSPESSRLLLHRKRKPDMLFKILKKTKQFPNRCLTYGYAKVDPQEATTLVFRLDSSANQPPRMVKLGRVFLRSNKKLRFRKLKLVVQGSVVEDTEDDTDRAP